MEASQCFESYMQKTSESSAGTDDLAELSERLNFRARFDTVFQTIELTDFDLLFAVVVFVHSGQCCSQGAAPSSPPQYGGVDSLGTAIAAPILVSRMPAEASMWERSRTVFSQHSPVHCMFTQKTFH